MIDNSVIKNRLIQVLISFIVYPQPPLEMLETIEQASLVSSDIKEWLGKEIASNV